jgi:hypothetical protein
MSVWFWIGLLAMVAINGEVQGETRERMVFCKDRAGPCAASSTLGTASRGTWAKVDDATLVSGNPPLPPVLYFSIDAYQDAMVGLDAKERAQAILHRLERVVAHPETLVFERVKADLLQVAEATVSAGHKDIEPILDAAMIVSGGESRLRSTTPGEILDMSRENLAQLMVELPKGPLLDAFAKEAATLAGLAVEVRQDARQALMPFAEPNPVYFVPSVSEKTYHVLNQLGQYPHKWHGGVVTILSPRKLAEPPWKGQAVQLLYPGSRVYLHDINELTPAQLDQRLRSRLKGDLQQAHAHFVADLAFERAIFCRLLAEPIERARVPWLARWQEAVALDTDNIRQALASAQPEANKQPKPRLAVLRADLKLGAAILRDTRPAAADKLTRAMDLLSRLAE